LAQGSGYLVRIIAECSELLSAVDTSDAPFTIQAHVLTAPGLIYPIGSESVYGTVLIRWQASLDSWGGPVTYAVHYSANGGSDWTEIYSDLTTTSCSWNTAGLSGGSNYVVKVVASCGHEASVEALSGIFTLVPSTTTPTTTTTTGPGGPGVDLVPILLLAGGGIAMALVVACVLFRTRLGRGSSGGGS
jgi:hypothetical protein